MGHLHDCFEASRTRIGLKDLPCSISDKAPHVLRFEIGGTEEIYLADHRKPNGVYVENAVDRALGICAHLPAAPNLLCIVRTLRPAEEASFLRECQTLLGLCAPDETVDLPAAGGTVRRRCYWNLPEGVAPLRKLFRQIIRAEIDPEGLEWLVPGVYLLDSRTDVIFNLFDDTGADVAAKDWESLCGLCKSCNAWLDSRCRDSIDRTLS